MNSKVIKDDLLKNKYGIECEGYGDYDGYHIDGYRYKLEITIANSNNDNTLACIMMNPSTTFPDEEWENPNWKNKLGFPKSQKRKTKGFDPTVRNVIRMAYSKGYSKVFIFNLFPYIHPTSEIAIKSFNEKQKENYDEISTWITDCSSEEGCKKVLVAWGCTLPKGKENKDRYKTLQKEYIKIFMAKGIKPSYYEWNKEKDCPYHPSLQVDNCWTKDEKDNIVKRQKGNKSEKGIIQLFIEGNSEFKEFDKSYFN